MNTVEAFYGWTNGQAKALVLNACDTLDGAEVLLPSVPVVIAMSDTISDIGAAVFASKLDGSTYLSFEAGAGVVASCGTVFRSSAFLRTAVLRQLLVSTGPRPTLPPSAANRSFV